MVWDRLDSTPHPKTRAGASVATKAKAAMRSVDGGGASMALTCLLAAGGYFFGRPMAIELHWLWMAFGSLCMAALAILQYVRMREVRRRDDDLSALLDAVPHLLFFKDTSFRYQALNSEFERTFGIDVHASLGMTDKELFGPEIYDRFVAQDKELFASGQARTFDQELIAHGQVRNIRVRKRPVFGRDGKLRGIVGLAVDVTDELTLQRQLEEANARLGMALDAARMGTWEWNLDTDEVQGDDRGRELFGIRAHEVDVSAVFGRMHPDDVDGVRRDIQRARQGEEGSSYEFRVIDDTGAMRWVEGFSSPERARSGSTYMIGVAHDITQRRTNELALAGAKARADRALAELEQSRVNLELALVVGGLGVWRSVTRVDSTAPLFGSALLETPLAADPKIREICGHPADAVITYRDLFRQLHPQDRERVAAKIDAAYQQRQDAYRDRFRICRRDGAVRTLDVIGIVTVMPDPDDGRSALIAFTGIAKDITEEETLKADLIAKADEARAAVEAKREFLAMMSHEVRTPLNGILGMIDLVIDGKLVDAQRAMLVRCRESSLELLRIINDILDYAKIKAHKLGLESRPFSLAGLTESVCGIFTAETLSKSIGLDFDVDPELPPVIVGDALRLRQVLTNLVGNAVKFTERGGVRVHASRLPEDQLQLVVEDTGIGIAPESMGSLFDPFTQADLATTRRYGGTGLGLTIVKQLVELMQGRIRCESELNRGTRFIVTLPLVAWSEGADDLLQGPPLTEASEELRPISRGGKVLVAEDHPINREVISLQLRRLGFEADCVADGEAAWKKLDAPGADYVLLLTDCHMSGLDGYALARRRREQEGALGLPRLPIVAVTGSALSDEALRCVAAGMDACMSKPMQMHELRRVLGEVLHGEAGRPM